MKRVLSLFLSVLMLTSVVAAVDLSAYAATSNKCGSNVMWKVSSSGTLTFSGKGKIDEYEGDSSSKPWWNYTRDIKKVVIGEGITSIPCDSLYGCINIESIEIPSTLNAIANYDESETVLPFDFPEDSGTYTALKKITVDKNNKVFSSKDGVLYNKKQTILLQYPQQKASTSYTMPNTVKKIVCDYYTSMMGAKGGFSYCTNLKSVTLSSKLTKIPAGTFCGCKNLSTVKIGKNVTSIGKYAFSQSGIKSITIPASVTSIGTGAFDGCTKLQKITVKSGNKKYSSKSGVLFNKSQTGLVNYPAGKTSKSYTVPSTVTKIKASAFESSKYLESVKMTDVVEIEKYAFYGCKKLSSVKLPNTLTSIGTGAFRYCTKLASIKFPFKLKTIGKFAFEGCSKLTKVTIPKSVTKVAAYAFEDCNKLTTIVVYPKNVTLGSYAFGWSDTTIKGSSGSTAEKYAKKHSGYITFKKLSSHEHSYETKTIKATTGHSGGKYKVCTKCSAYKTSASYAKIDKVSLSTTSYKYNGKAKKPTVTVKDSKGNKISSKNYTVTYIDRSTGKEVKQMKAVGKYYVKVKFKGNYSGAVKTAVTIKKA